MNSINDLGQLRARSHLRGFTLIEAAIAITILFILLGTAAPSFSSILSSNKVTVQSNTILESLQLARNDAIVRQKFVHLCQLDRLEVLKCSDDYSNYRDWSVGWLIFIDLNQSNDYDSGDELIRVVAGVDSTGLVFNQRGRLRFFPRGTARSAGFTVCDGQKKHYRHVYLLHTGRARVIEELSQKQQLKCDAAAARKIARKSA